MKIYSVVLMSLFSLLSVVQAEAPIKKFPVIGYTWPTNPEQIRYKYVTHLNYSFIKLKADGSLTALRKPEILRKIVVLAHQNGVKVGIAVGGWNNGDDSEFEKMASGGETRKRFISELLKLVKKYDLDGIDIDWEYPNPGQSAKNYSLLIKELSQETKKNSLYLSAAVVKYGKVADGVLKEVFENLDYVNIMSYDGASHGTFGDAEKALDFWLARGVPKSKAILGLPFYGRSPAKAYKTLLKEDSKADQKDVVRTVHYNGIPTIKKKTAMAMKRAGGVMFWELTQDVDGDKSLLKAIHDTVHSQ